MQLNQRNLLVAGGILVALIIVLGTLVVLGGGDDGAVDVVASSTTSSTTTTSTTTTSTLPSGPFAPLTGEHIDADSPLLDRAAIVVKISNNMSVQDNWQGIDQADVVIEERIEANATRFAAVFHSILPESVGPIRSGRTSDLDLLANLGTPILVYSGANPSVTGQLRSLENDGLVTLVVDRGTNVDLVRDNAFSRPDNLFSNLVEIEEKYRDGAGVALPLFEYREATSGDRSAGVDVDGVTVKGADTVSFVWDETRGYVRVQNGDVHTTLDGTPFVFDNIVVLEVEYTPSTFAPGSVDAKTVGAGTLNLLIGGTRYEGTWSRESSTSAYQFFDAAGDPLRLDPGQTWMTLVPAGSYEFVVAPEIAALALEADG
ncbi:MAG: DUF3048 domain-containing protein [Acidimicrobiales bacterium]